MPKTRTTLTALAIAVGTLATPQTAFAQMADAKTAREQVSWALNDLDPILMEENDLQRSGRDLDRRRTQLQNSERNAGYTISNFNQHCTNGRWANPCNGWQNELDSWQVGFERDLAALNNDYDRLNAQQRRIDDRIQQKRSELMNAVGNLLRACRSIASADRGDACTIPAQGRYTGDFVNEARSRLRRGL